MEKYDIFISYRRTYFKTANLVATRLKNAGFKVFIDTEEMHSGKFDTQLYRHIENCKDFVLILSPGSLERCNDENDWVRHEIMHALACKKNIIPLLIDGFEWPAQMPKGMHDLNMYQSMQIADRPEQYSWAIDQLSSRYLASKAKKKSSFNGILLLIVLALAGASAFLFFKGGNSPQSETVNTELKDSVTVETDTVQQQAEAAPVIEETAPVVEETIEEVVIDEKYEAGVKEMKAGNGIEAISLFEESGSAASLKKIGEIYMRGCGSVEKNEIMAEDYFKQAKKLEQE